MGQWLQLHGTTMEWESGRIPHMTGSEFESITASLAWELVAEARGTKCASRKIDCDVTYRPLSFLVARSLKSKQSRPVI